MKGTSKLIDRVKVRPGRKVKLKHYDTDWTLDMDKEAAHHELAQGVQRLAEQQDMLYAQDTYAVLVIFQAMKRSGHVFPTITEDVQETCLQRLTATIGFTEGVPPDLVDPARRQIVPHRSLTVNRPLPNRNG